MYSSTIYKNNSNQMYNYNILEECDLINEQMENEFCELYQEQGILELAYFKINRKELPLNESFSDIIDKTIKILIAIKDRIKVLFDNFSKMIIKYFFDDDQFKALYRKRFRDITIDDLKDYKYKGFNFQINDKHDIKTAYIKMGQAKLPINISDEEISGRLRSASLDHNSTDILSAAEYNKELFKFFRDGAEQKVDLKIDRTFLNELEDSLIFGKYTNSNIKITAYSYQVQFQAIIEDKIKSLKNIRDMESADINRKIKVLKCSISVLQSFNANFLSALRDRELQNRSIIIDMVRYVKQNQKINESYISDDIIDEGFDNINADIENEFFIFCQEEALSELKDFETNRCILPFNESDHSNKSIIDRAIDYFKGIINTIKKIINDIVRLFYKYVASDEDFLKKYEDHIKDGEDTYKKHKDKSTIMGVNLSRFSPDFNSIYTFTGFQFDLKDNIDNIWTLLKRKADDIVENYPEKITNEEIFSVLRGSILHQQDTGSLNSTEFEKELFKYFRNGQSNQVQLSPDANKVINELKNSKDMINKAKEVYDSTKKSVDNIMSDLKKNTNDKDIKKRITILKYSLSILQQYNKAYLKAIRDNNKQNKSIALKFVGLSKIKTKN